MVPRSITHIRDTSSNIEILIRRFQQWHGTGLLFTEGKVFGSKEGKGLGSGHCDEQRKEVEQGLYCARSEF
jgi:hypothetical protein